MNKTQTMALLASLFLIAGLVESKERKVTASGEAVVHIEALDNYQDSANDQSFDNYMRKNGKNYRQHYKTNRKMRRRIKQLELAVIQLQTAVFDLQDSMHNGHYSYEPEPRYTCLVTTSSKGTFMGKGLTKLEAQGNAKLACQEKVGGFWCEAGASVKCDSNVDH